MREQWRIFQHAVMFFTRIPVPSDPHFSSASLDKASRYFPLVGWIVGGLTALVYMAAVRLFPADVAVLLSTGAGILLTGAFHEDGLADACDGFGGGWDKDRILEIMKDSRLGTFGAVALMLVLLLKWRTLSAIDPAEVPVILWIGHSLSRLASVGLIRFGSYARADLQSKAKPLATGMTNLDFLIAAFFGLMPLALMPNPWGYLVIAPALVAAIFMGRYFHKWIQGYTGDCLGSVQQVSELLIYLTFLGVL